MSAEVLVTDVGDHEEILRRYGWAPTTPLARGLERTYAWIHDQVAQSCG